MTTTGYNPTAMPGPETRFEPRVHESTPRTSEDTGVDCSKVESD